MSPFQVLGLTRRASLAEVKRAYAQLLKRHRPDEDPVGFQRIHEAFEACVARVRARDAREREREHAPEPARTPEPAPARGHEDELPEADAGGAGRDRQVAPDLAHGHGTEAGEEDGAYAFRLPDDAEAPPDPAKAEFERLHQDVLGHFEHDSPEALEAFLAQDERLVSLAAKRALSARLFQHAAEWVEQDWRRLDVLFRFFEVDSLSDPRLRDDYFARELWLRVRGDERFEHQLRQLRASAAGKLADRLAMQEMFDPPSRWRRWKILALPSVAKELRRKYEALEAADPARAQAAVADSVHRLWLPLTDPARLDWRRMLLVLVKVLVYAAPIVALFSAASGFSWPMFASFLGWTWGVVYGAWLLWTLLLWARERYFLWRIARWGQAEAPPGASLFADTTAVTCGVFTLGAMLVWAIARSAGSPFGGAILQAFLLLGAAGVLVEKKPGTRWDAVGFLVAWSLVIICAPFDRAWPGFDGDDRASLALLSPAFAVLGLIVVDHLHARWAGACKSDITARWSLPLVLLTVLAGGLLYAWYLLAGG